MFGNLSTTERRGGAIRIGSAGLSISRVSLCRIFGASSRIAEAPSASLKARAEAKRWFGFFDSARMMAASTLASRPGTREIRRAGRSLICACIRSYSLLAENGGAPVSNS